MRFLHVIASLSPESGGPSEAMRQLTGRYQDFGDEAEFVCQDDPGSPFFATVPVPVNAVGAGAGTYGYSRNLLRWLKENVSRFDGVIVNGIWTYSSLAAAIAARGRVPYAVFTHGMLDPWFKRRYPLKHLKKRLYWPLQYPVLCNAGAVLFTSAMERDLAPQSMWPNKWNGVVVPYGAGDPTGDPQAHLEALYSRLPQLRGRRYLLFMSRIHEKKGCDLLIQAFARIAADHPEVDLVVAGPDQVGLQSKLQKMAQDLGIEPRVHWPGMLKGDVKYGALRACDAFILPSHQENFGVVVAEALACGRPVLISNQVNIWREIEQEDVGLVAPDTLEGTQALLSRWLSLDESSRAAMVARTAATFRKNYSMRSAAGAIHDLFLKLTRA
jgi:glycosyltransferase involved in cell wall biosynthesis